MLHLLAPLSSSLNDPEPLARVGFSRIVHCHSANSILKRASIMLSFRLFSCLSKTFNFPLTFIPLANILPLPDSFRPRSPTYVVCGSFLPLSFFRLYAGILIFSFYLNFFLECVQACYTMQPGFAFLGLFVEFALVSMRRRCLVSSCVAQCSALERISSHFFFPENRFFFSSRTPFFLTRQGEGSNPRWCIVSALFAFLSVAVKVFSNTLEVPYPSPQPSQLSLHQADLWYSPMTV